MSPLWGSRGCNDGHRYATLMHRWRIFNIIQSFVGREKGGLLMVIQFLFLCIEAKLNPSVKISFIKRKRKKKVISAKKRK